MASLDSADVFVTMPKFTFRWELELKSVLSALGMGNAFACGTADFTPLFPAGGLQTCITRVKHKTFVDVNQERPTEAAAATSVEVGITSAPRSCRIVVDRPFLVAIRERLTGTILFLGRVHESGCELDERAR